MDWQQARPSSSQGRGLRTDYYFQALERHRKLLGEHLVIWQTFEQESQPGSAIRLAAEKCLHDTRLMIQSCADIPFNVTSVGSAWNETVLDHRKHSAEEPHSQPATKRARKSSKHSADSVGPGPAVHIPPITDASGLFTIDPNPTKVDALLSDPNKPSRSKKRKQRRSEQELNQVTDDERYTNGGSLPLRKRVKTAHEVTVQPSPEEMEEYNNSFEAKVELRLKQKEQDRQKKAMKKRKRGSDLTEEREATTQQEPSATSDAVRQVNTSKRVRRAAAGAATSAIQQELSAAVVPPTKRKGIEIIELDDGSDYGDQTSRKKKKKRNSRNQDN